MIEEPRMDTTLKEKVFELMQQGKYSDCVGLGVYLGPDASFVRLAADFEKFYPGAKVTGAAGAYRPQITCLCPAQYVTALSLVKGVSHVEDLDEKPTITTYTE